MKKKIMAAILAAAFSLGMAIHTMAAVECQCDTDACAVVCPFDDGKVGTDGPVHDPEPDK